jgi:hypothetical protein
MVKAGRLMLILLLARWTWLFLVWPMRQDVIGASFLNLISLPFHEAGHILFSPFGDLMTSLGGSLTQVLVPIVCGIAFLTTSFNPFGAAVMCWWTGENLSEVALYIDDARALKLVLLGGKTGAEVEGHDWEHILELTGALHRDHQIAAAVQWTGAALMLGAIVWAIVLVVRPQMLDHGGRRDETR